MIRMRNNTKPDSVCCECGQPRKKVLDMFDIQIGGEIFTICDLCNEALFYKTLRASCNVNGRVKTKEDIAIINKRGRDRWNSEKLQEKFKEKEANAKYDKEAYAQIKKSVNSFNEEGDDDE